MAGLQLCIYNGRGRLTRLHVAFSKMFNLKRCILLFVTLLVNELSVVPPFYSRKAVKRQFMLYVPVETMDGGCTQLPFPSRSD